LTVLPGKKYLPEDILRIAWHRKWFIVLPFLLVSLGTAAVAWKLPNVYRSSTLIAVIPQTVPESYVKATVTTKVEDRLQAITQTALSRNFLEPLIREDNLYSKEFGKKMMMEDVVEKMKNKDITIEILKTSDAIRISYVNEDRKTAKAVADKIAGKYVSESLNDRTQQAQQTAVFLETQLANARSTLEGNERALAVYKNRHSGELPAELQGNLQVMNNLQMQLQALSQTMNQEQNRRYLVEKTIAGLSETQQAPPTVTISGDDPTAVAGGNTAAQLEAAKAQLQMLRLRYKPDHPDVGRMQKAIRDLEAKLQAEALQRPLSSGAEQRPATPEEAQRQAKLRDAQTELEMVDRQIAGQKAEEQRLRGLMAAYQGRVEATAGREPELTKLMRDYDTLRRIYDDLKTKQEAAKTAAALVEGEKGEQFRILDDARLPERPVSPNRPMIDMMGMLAGLGLGIGLVALLEYRDDSFRTDDEVVRVLSLPVMAVIPLMLSAADRKGRRRRSLLVGGLTAVFMVCAVAAGAWFLWRYQF
jgi:polysaccharide chain length determinant protein (PEP-CTERM system associated)